MNAPRCDTPDETVLLPDIRQSICHTLIAVAFGLIHVQNPVKEALRNNILSLVVLAALPIAVGISWQFFIRRLSAWKALPQETRSRLTRTPGSLRTRAISHLLMALLAAALTAIRYIGHLVSPLESSYGVVGAWIILAADALVGVLSVAVAASSVRDLISYLRAMARPASGKREIESQAE